MQLTVFHCCTFLFDARRGKSSNSIVPATSWRQSWKTMLTLISQTDLPMMLTNDSCISIRDEIPCWVTQGFGDDLQNEVITRLLRNFFHWSVPWLFRTGAAPLGPLRREHMGLSARELVHLRSPNSPREVDQGSNSWRDDR